MRAADTNVVARLIVRDDARQVRAAEAFVAPGAWVSTLVLVETLWVLARAYALDRKRQIDAVEMLLDHVTLVLESPEAVAAALEAFRGSQRLGFSDCLILEVARRAGHSPLGTFDRGFGKLPHVTVL